MPATKRRVGASRLTAARQTTRRVVCAAGRDHGHRHRGRDRARELEVVAVARAVAVHAREQDLAWRRGARTRAHATASSVVARRPPCVNTRQVWPTRVASMLATTHCAPKRSAHSLRVSGCSTGALLKFHLVGAGAQRRASRLDGAQPAADRERYRNRSRRAAHDVGTSRAPRASRRCREHDLVRAFLLVAHGHLADLPTSRRPTNFTPFTTRSPCTSRHARSRRVSARRPPRATAPSPFVLKSAALGDRLPHGQPQRGTRPRRRGVCRCRAARTMQRRARLHRERAHPVIPDRRGQRAFVVRAPAEIHRDVHERVVHRDRAFAVAPRASGTMRASASPVAIATSRSGWCGRSPLARSVRSSDAYAANAVIMWSRNG